MATLTEDPLIAAMAIDRMLPLHYSSRRLRELYPQCPRVYGVAVLADVSIRRWWPLKSAARTDRLQDTGLDNLWVHVDSDGVIDWAGVVDPTVRMLPDDSYFAAHRGDCLRDGVAQLPSEAALTTWVAHRCHRTLEPLFAKLHAVSGGAIPVATMWHIVGSMVVAAATQVPQLAGADELTAMRRGQAVLDALVSFGLPVRGVRPRLGARPNLLADGVNTRACSPHQERQTQSFHRVSKRRSTTN